jgi:hypothetical protein
VVGTPSSTDRTAGGGISVSGVPPGFQHNGIVVTILIVVSVLFVIMAVVFWTARGILKRLLAKVQTNRLWWARAEQPAHALGVSTAQPQSQTPWPWTQQFASDDSPFVTQSLPTERTPPPLAPEMQGLALPVVQQLDFPSAPTALWGLPEEEVSEPS